MTSGNMYEVGRKLKNCIFGQVNHAVKVVKNEAGVYTRAMPIKQYAIKVYFRARLQQYHGRTQENPFQEIAAMQYVGNDHPNVMGQIECCGDGDNLYSIMDFSDGSEMFDIVDQHGPLNEETGKKIFLQIVRGTQRIHGMGLGHRDMSLENVLCSRRGVARIIDFGMSLLLPRRPDGTFVLIRPQGTCGKRNYISPEVVANQRPFNPQHADLWALGVKLFIMLTGVPPVDMAYELDERYQMVRSGRLRDMLQHWNFSLSPEVVDLMTQILQAEPAQRLSLEGMLAHPWLRSAVEEAGPETAPAIAPGTTTAAPAAGGGTA